MIKVAILTISDKCSKGGREDKNAKIIDDLLDKNIYQVVKYEIIPEEADKIKEKLVEYSDRMKTELILTNGGTGFTARDVAPEATEEVIEKKVPGIPEAMRMEGFKLTKKAMLSRGIAGIRGRTLIINLPGSSRGAKESLEAILDELPHGLDMIIEKEY